MTVAQGIFYLIAALAVAGGLGVVLIRSTVYAALFLILTLLAVAGVSLIVVAVVVGIPLEDDAAGLGAVATTRVPKFLPLICKDNRITFITPMIESGMNRLPVKRCL